jgi:hypothetical protein
MKVLLAFEFKKLINSKAIWVALALSTALLALNSYNNIRLTLDGSVGGMREVYARYEGQTLTDTLHERMPSDYRTYAAARPDEFQPSTVDLGYWAQFGHWHAYGMSMAYQSLMTRQTVEVLQTEWQQAKDALQTGISADGEKLSGETRQSYETLTSQPPVVPVIHYDLGWTDTSSTFLIDMMMSVTGVGLSDVVSFGIVLSLSVLLIGLVGWGAERRMEPVVLTAARRKSALLAKALAAMSAAALVAVSLCLWELCLRVVPFGFQGWNVVPATYSATHLHAWAVSALLVALGSAASAALMALVCAAVRGSSLAGLGLSALTLAAQFFLWKLCYALYVNWLFANMNSSARFIKPRWAAITDAVTQVLPFYRMNTHGAGNLDGLALQGGMLALALAVAVSLCGLGLWLAPNLYLRNRKV